MHRGASSKAARGMATRIRALTVDYEAVLLPTQQQVPQDDRIVVYLIMGRIHQRHGTVSCKRTYLAQ